MGNVNYKDYPHIGIRSLLRARKSRKKRFGMGAW